MINRNTLSNFCVGQGIEIGAYHNPFPVNPRAAKVTYVDKWPYEKLIEMRNNDPNLRPDMPLAPVDIIDDGETLKKIPDNSQDFVLSSHQLEHCISPLTAIENHVRVLKKGGVIIYAVPDMRFTFDKGRDAAWYHELDHLYSKRELTSDDILPLYEDYFEFVDKVKDPKEREQRAMKYMLENRDVHFHCWTANTLMEMFVEAPFNMELELFSRAGHENFVVVRKL